MADILMKIRLKKGVDWDKKNGRIKATSKAFANVTRINNQLNSKLASYRNQVADFEEMGVLDQLTAAQIKERLTDVPRQAVTLKQFIEDQIKLKISVGRENTARMYQDVLNKLARFSDKELSFSDIDYDFLTKLEHKHLSEGSKISSLSVYLRTLRLLYNQAIKSGVAKRSHYPFEHYSIKNGEPSRRALSETDFKKLLNAKFKDGSAEQIGRDYYLMSFYLQGMNWMDMCYLKNSDFSDGKERIAYIRRKTGKSFNIKVTGQLIEIINRLKPNSEREDDFVLPVLNLDLDPSFYDRRITNRRLKINKYLHRIAGSLDIPKFSIYSARHTYATLLWEKSESAAVTQLSLGHQTEKQTQDYLSHFGNKKVDNAADDLFNNLGSDLHCS